MRDTTFGGFVSIRPDHVSCFSVSGHLDIPCMIHFHMSNLTEFDLNNSVERGGEGCHEVMC